MSGSSTPTAAMEQPKQLSSRLLTMKFMQRAAASSPTQSTATFPRTPASPPSSKRRRIDIPSQPYTPSPTTRTPSQFISADSKMDQATQSQARGSIEGDETEWVLKINLPRAKPQVPQFNGHRHNPDEVEDEDEDEEDEVWTNQVVGRQTYGSFKRKKAQSTTVDAAENDAEMSSASDSDASSSSPASGKAPRYHQARDMTRARPIQPPTRSIQPPTRSAQAPKRFFDQMSLDGLRTNDMTPEKQRKKQQHHRKKPRTTI